MKSSISLAYLEPVTSLAAAGVQFTTGTVDVKSAYNQCFAAATIVKDIPANCTILTGGIRNNEANAGYCLIDVAIGAAGQETDIFKARIGINASASAPFTLIIPRRIPAGSRIAIRASWSGAAGATVDCGTTVGQVA